MRVDFCSEERSACSGKKKPEHNPKTRREGRSDARRREPVVIEDTSYACSCTKFLCTVEAGQPLESLIDACSR